MEPKNVNTPPVNPLNELSFRPFKGLKEWQVQNKPGSPNKLSYTEWQTQNKSSLPNKLSLEGWKQQKRSNPDAASSSSPSKRSKSGINSGQQASKSTITEDKCLDQVTRIYRLRQDIEIGKARAELVNALLAKLKKVTDQDDATADVVATAATAHLIRTLTSTPARKVEMALALDA